MTKLRALRLRLGVGLELLEVGPDLRAIDGVELAISLAGLPRLAELHQRLAEIIEAVGRALAAGVRAVIGEQSGSGGGRIALVELRATDEVIGVADAAVLGIGFDERLQRVDRGVVIARLPLVKT